MPEYVCKVLIVGLGPSGMALANELQKYGIDYCIVCQRPAISEITRAVNVTPLSMATLEYNLNLNITNEAMPTNNINLYYEQKLINRISFQYQNFPHRKFCYIPQPVLEGMLYTKLGGKSNNNILENSKLIKLEQVENGYIGTFINDKNEEFIIRCTYLIGCDGNNSFVRHWLQIPSNEENYNSSFILYDIETPQPLSKESNYYLFDHGYMIIVPIDLNKYRIIISFDKLQKNKQSNYNQKVWIAEFITQHCNIILKDFNIIWFTQSEFRHRVANECKKGNCFLVGDAFHIFSPVGGMNLGVGLQDAINLGWKLAYVINNHAKAEILITYSIERQFIAEVTKNKTKYLTELMTQVADTDILKKYVGRLANRNYTKNELPWMISGYDSVSEIGRNSSQLHPIGCHISTAIKDKDTYTKLCKNINGTKFNILTNCVDSPIGCEYINSVYISELNMNGRFTIVRPDGYIYASGNNVNIVRTVTKLKAFLEGNKHD